MYRDSAQLGELITSRYSIRVSNGNHVLLLRILEVELYITSNTYPDPYTHCHPDQKLTSGWYFHKASSSMTAKHKEGTYKGLDITLGDSNTYVGVLIRSVLRYSIDNRDNIANTVINGPCLVVDEILKHAGYTTVRDYALFLSKVASRADNRVDRTDNITTLHPNLTLCYDDSLPLIIPLVSPRVGLQLKDVNSYKYRWLLARYISPTYKISKGIELVIATLILEQLTTDEICKLVGVSRNRVDQIRNYTTVKEGKLTKPEDIVAAYYAYANGRVCDDIQRDYSYATQ